MESEFWNHTMVSSDIDKYTTQFHELSKLVPHMATLEDKHIDRYIWGLAPKIRSRVWKKTMLGIKGGKKTNQETGVEVTLTNDKALERHLEEIHVTWDQFRKRNWTRWQMGMKTELKNEDQRVETSSIFIVTPSGFIVTPSRSAVIY
ncbi:hypothetical protein Tco_0604821 [Tanacetum coccineum]